MRSDRMSRLNALFPRASNEKLLIGTRLQINLLPAEVVAARGVKSLKRVLALAVAGFAALLVIAVVIVGLMVSAAEDSLAEEQERTGRLMTEQASYREVTVVTDRLELTQIAYLFTSATEVSWFDYLGYISATVPDDVTISTLVVSAASPLSGPPAAGDPLISDGLGSLTFTAVSPTVPDATEWSRKLAAVPGFADPRVTTLSLEDDEGEITYSTVVTVRLTQDAWTDRLTEIVGE